MHHFEDAVAVLCLGQDDPRGVAGGAENAAHFQHHLQRLQHIEL